MIDRRSLWRLGSIALSACIATGAAFHANADPGTDSQRAARAAAFAASPLHGMELSPDGEHVSAIRMAPDGTTMLQVTSVEDGATRTVLNSEPSANLRWCLWANDSRLLCGLSPFRQAAGPTRVTDMIGIDIDGGRFTELLEAQFGLARPNDRLIDLMSDDPQHVLVERYVAGGLQVFRLNIDTGQMESPSHRRDWAQGLPARELSRGTLLGSTELWLGDGRGSVRIRLSSSSPPVAEYLGRMPGETEWRTLYSVDHRTLDYYPVPLGLAGDGDEVLHLAPLDDRMALYGIDVADGERRLVMRVPDRDVSGVLMLGKTRRAVSAFHHDQRTRTAVFDARIAAVQRDAEAHLPNHEIVILGESWAQRFYLLLARDPTSAGRYFRLDAEEGALHEISPVYPELKDKALIDVRNVGRADDEAIPPGHLVLPPDGDGPYPAVILSSAGVPHMALWAFDHLAQYLAVSGYAVYRIEHAHRDTPAWSINGGLRYWRDASQRLTAAAAWLVDQQIANPDRICVIGERFDAHAAVMNVIESPDVFRCVVGIGGVYHPPSLEPAWANAPSAFEREVGRDRDIRRSGSPNARACEVSTPVLLIHAEHDSESPVSQSQIFAGRLARQGADHQLIILPDSDSAILPPAQRARMLSEIDAFLGASIGPVDASADGRLSE